MKPKTINGQNYFPQQEMLFNMLKPGTQFMLRGYSTLYTVTDDGKAKDMIGNTVDIFETTPVTPMKKF